MADTVIRVAPQAQYGRSPDGAVNARNEWWAGMDRNDADMGAINKGIGFANGQAANPTAVGATENAGLANNEASGANGHQSGAIGLAGTLARGQQPSQAAYQLQNGLNQATAQQTAIGRSARGGAALATAGADAQANTANLQQNAYQAGGMLRSRDMAAGRGMLAGFTEQQRGQDNQRLGQSNDFAAQNADLRDRASLGFGQAAVGLGGVANAGANQDLQYYNSGMGPVDAQDEANQARQKWAAAAQSQKVSANRQDGG